MVSDPGHTYDSGGIPPGCLGVSEGGWGPTHKDGWLLSHHIHSSGSLLEEAERVPGGRGTDSLPQVDFCAASLRVSAHQPHVPSAHS